MSIQLFCPFVNWVVFLILSCKKFSIYSGSKSFMCFANIFIQKVACPFISLMLSFEVEAFLIWKKSNLSVFSPMDFAFGTVSKNSAQSETNKEFLLCLLLGVL